MRHCLRDIASARKVPFREPGFPGISNMFRQAGFVPVLVRLDFPVIAAGLDKEHRIGAVALPSFYDFFETKFFLFREKILIGVVHFLITRDAHTIVISFRLVFNFGASFIFQPVLGCFIVAWPLWRSTSSSASTCDNTGIVSSR